MGKIKKPGTLLWFFVMLIFRIAMLFGLIGLIAYGVWAFLYWLLM